jgi:hypothetical protein
MKFYNLKDKEMATLPYWEFENQYNLAHPGHSYSHDGVKTLVYQSFAALAGMHKRGLKEMAFLRCGRRLFDEQ